MHESGSVPPRAPRGRALAAATVVTLLWAAVCNAVLDLLQQRRLDGWEMPRSVVDTPGAFVVSTVILWVLLVLAVAVTNRLFLSLALVGAATLTIGLVSHEKIRLRREPLYPADMAFADETGFLADMVPTGRLVTGVAAVASVVVLVLLTGRIVRRLSPAFGVPMPRRDRRWVAVRVVSAVAAVSALAYSAQFNHAGNQVRAAYDRAGASWLPWIQEANYSRNGFIAGFLYNLDAPAMSVPPGYGETEMRRVAARYAAVAARYNIGRSSRTLDDLNIVIVLSETFTDPTLVPGVTFDEDPLPYTRRLMRSTYSGEMLATRFGGGTANSEFEALTGMSVSQFLPQMDTPYQMLIPGRDSFPSVITALEDRAHDAVALHPSRPTMYQRHEVYPAMGFSEFLHADTMRAGQRIDDNPFISDAAAFDEVEKLLDESEDPLLLNVVTMQNHHPMGGKYSDPIPVDGVSEETRRELEHYARGLRHSDIALREFLRRLKTSEEETAVIFYGDHAPGFWGTTEHYEDDPALFRRTPYFLWTNVGGPARRGEPLLSPIHFLPALFDQVRAPLSPYYALLTELRKEIPAMAQGTYYLPDGRAVTEGELPSSARAVLEDYRLVQYDLAVGKRHAEAALFAAAH